MAWHSTTLSFASRHCPRALDYRLAGEPYDRTPYLVGVAAHAVLQALGEAARERGPMVPSEDSEVAVKACGDLIASGRIFEGEQEPPLPSEAVWLGCEIALGYLRLSEPPSGRCKYEIGLGVDRDWKPCAYRDAWLGGIIDVLGEDFDEEVGGRVLLVKDWKTAWRAGSEDTYILQRRIHALVAWAHADRSAYAGLATEVVNLRTGKNYRETIAVGDAEGEHRLATWRAAIETEIRAREQQVGEDGQRPVAPGAYCAGCPYLFRCADGRAAMMATVTLDDPTRMATTFAALDAAHRHLRPLVQRATGEAPIPVAGGIVGYQPTEQRKLKAGAVEALWQTWTGGRKDLDADAMRSVAIRLLTVVGLSPTQADTALRKVEKSKAERATWRDKWTAPVVKRRFGVHRLTGEDDDADGSDDAID
jgi:hypothetical protein